RREAGGAGGRGSPDRGAQIAVASGWSLRVAGERESVRRGYRVAPHRTRCPHLCGHCVAPVRELLVHVEPPAGGGTGADPCHRPSPPRRQTLEALSWSPHPGSPRGSAPATSRPRRPPAIHCRYACSVSSCRRSVASFAIASPWPTATTS